jgi:hypothetical protein
VSERNEPSERNLSADRVPAADRVETPGFVGGGSEVISEPAEVIASFDSEEDFS